MHKDKKNQNQQQTWADWAYENAQSAASNVASGVNDAASYAARTAKEAVMRKALEQMPQEMGRYLLYGITSDDVSTHSKKINDYVQSARQSYDSFISKFSSGPARSAIELVIAYMFPPVFGVGVASYSLDAFVNMEQQDKIFIVKTLLPKMSQEYQQEYCNLLKSKKDGEVKTQLITAVNELAISGTLKVDAISVLQPTIHKKSSTFFPSLASLSSFLPRSRSSSSSSTSAPDSPKNKNS